MAQPSSGDDLEFLCPDTHVWTQLEDIRLEEAKVYRWRSTYSLPFRLLINGMPLPMSKTAYGWEGEWGSPFQSGQVTFIIEQTERRALPAFIYSDNRKLTESEYERMIADILEEAAACYAHQGARLGFDGDGIARRISLAQWDYIDRSFHRLQRIFRDIQSKPLRRLKRTEQWIRRENVKHVTPGLLAWSERHAGGGMTEEIPVPELIWDGIRKDDCDVYENRVLRRQLQELSGFLRQYRALEMEGVSDKAALYDDRIAYWLRSPFLYQVRSHEGPIVISQAFRKHPSYRLWFDWFNRLLWFNTFKVGMKNAIPLKNTYELYEIWVFMKMVGWLRQAGCLQDASELFLLEQDRLVLNLSKKKESRIHLLGGATLAYQREFKRSSENYVTYTHAMYPDIVLESDDKLYVFDPKYRLDHNLPMALGEMHKYRDGIIRVTDGTRAVEEAFIVTPAEGVDSSRLFEEDYRDRHRMGAFRLRPGLEESVMKKRLLSLSATNNLRKGEDHAEEISANH
ncbi:restriction endonuclease-like protein [Cohnella ginsengisoli]|uniref:Restriction endonuclease-like protein n=1 Tax=Cohnella ginsengisoli TaxID=425004 RepID=A0A9X4QN35_9BACL|nr:DUF2357 domain-containing protein [Cohnella ginsengisoli]MDG0792051.1 restriction endonuclease-like protein [Cohnella ginsengisoli]